MSIDKTTKSSRILQSKRYTQTQQSDAQEVFTRVLDLNATEIYIDQSLIPSSSLPYSSSAQNGLTSGVIKYYYRQRLTPSNTLDGSNYNVYFFINPTSSTQLNNGVGPGLLDANQQTNFISPKYAPGLTGNTEDSTPGYQVKLTDSGGTIINPTEYTFDYKTGVLQYSASSGITNITTALYLSAYQYVGRTLADLSTSITASSISASSFIGSFTGSLTGSVIGSLTGTASWANNVVTASYITSSFFSGSNAALSASYATTASYVIGGTSTSAFPYTGSAEISGSLKIIGSGSTLFLISGSGGELFKIVDSGSSTALFSVSSGSTTILSINSSKNVSISGSLIVTGSITGSLTGSVVGSLTGTASWANSASNAFTSSYITSSFFSGSNAALSASFSTTSSFASSIGSNSLPSQINVTGVTASFTGSYIGDLTGTSSWANNTNYAVTSSKILQNFGTIGGGSSPILIFGVLSGASKYDYLNTISGISFTPNTKILSGVTASWANDSITASYISGSIFDSLNPALSSSFSTTSSFASSIGNNSLPSQISVTGVTASFTGSHIGSLTGTASWANSASNAFTASYITSSFFSGSNAALSSSFSTTSSFASSIGSNSLPSQINTTGITASFTGSLVGALTGTASWANNVATASYITSSFFSGSNAALSASYAANATTATNANNLGLGSTGANSNYNLLIVPVAGGGTSAVYVDSDTSLQFNPQSNTLLIRNPTTSASLVVTGSAIISSSLNVYQGITGSLTGSVIGSLTGTASWANNAITASYVTGSIFDSTNLVLSSSYAVTASYALNAGGSGPSTTIKAGSGSIASFAGTPLTSSITFTSAFSNNDYAVTITGEDARVWTIQSKVSGGFTINSNSSVALTGPVYWIATPFGS